MSLKTLLPSKALFDSGRWLAYLDTAAEGLPLRDSGKALSEYFEDKSSGSPGRTRMFQAEKETLHLAAILLGTSAKNVAFAGNATDALNLLGSSIRWKSGDEVLITDLEFPSNVVCWLRLREQGVRVEVIPSDLGVIELSFPTLKSYQKKYTEPEPFLWWTQPKRLDAFRLAWKA
jgi:selenocysteine lyase/cysteine desulfurase